MKSQALLMVLIIAFLTTGITNLQAQDPPPPPPPGHGSGGNVPGGGAPLTGGLAILLVLGAAYGGKKVYHFSTRKSTK
jgi:hypothetical protein